MCNSSYISRSKSSYELLLKCNLLESLSHLVLSSYAINALMKLELVVLLYVWLSVFCVSYTRYCDITWSYSLAFEFNLRLCFFNLMQP